MKKFVIPALVLCCCLIFAAACAGPEDDRDTYAVTFVATYYGIVGSEEWGKWERFLGEDFGDWHPEWEEEKKGIGKYDDDDGREMPIGDVDVWRSIPFTKTEQTNTLGRLSNLPSPPDGFREDHEFLGWVTSGGTSVTTQTVFSADTSVFARWKGDENADVFQPGYVARELAGIPAKVLAGGASFTYTIEVSKNETLPPQTMDYGYGGRRVYIILQGRPTNGVYPIITLSGLGSLFDIYNNVTLELRNIWLSGGERNSKALLTVNSGGRLIIGQNAQDKTLIFNNASEDTDAGGAITVFGGGECVMNGGELSENTSLDSTREIGFRGIGGAGVNVRGEGALFIMNGGKIHRNSTPEDGGGVMVFRYGTFIMNGGEIYDNYALFGGGVQTFMGLFIMNGGKIYKNMANDGGGVFVNRNRNTWTNDSYDPRKPDNPPKGIPGHDESLVVNDPANKQGFYFHGGEIYDNSVANAGGGVANSWHSFTYMTGGIISDNRGWEVAGVKNYGLFIMRGGTITRNNGSYGGGVYAAEGRFIMEGGEIINNESSTTGAGVLVKEYFLMYGGRISGNTAGEYGGGVYITSTGSFAMSGGIIEGNTASRADTGTIYFGAENTSSLDRGTAFYGTRDGDYDVILPHGYWERDGDDTTTDEFIVTSYMGPYPDETKIEVRTGGELWVNDNSVPLPTE
jgi:hypothetical protein